MLILVGVVDGLLWFCLIDLCWGVSLRPSAQRVSIVIVGKIPSGLDLYSQMYQNQHNLVKEVEEIRNA